MDTVSWSAFAAAQPHLALAIAARFAAHPHHVISTLHADGSPRAGGTNVFITDEIRVGSMPRARRVDDLRRDPRCSLHSAPLDEAVADGDAKLDCVAVEMTIADTKAWLASTGHPTGDGVGFMLRIRAATLTSVSDGKLVVETWSPELGARTVLR